MLVTVEEAPATTIGYGGGLEVGQRLRRDEATASPSEQLEVAPRAFFEIGRRNLFGKNRSVNLFTRVSLRPMPTDATARDALRLGFSDTACSAPFASRASSARRPTRSSPATIEQQTDRASTSPGARSAPSWRAG